MPQSSQSSQFAAANPATIGTGARNLRGWFVIGVVALFVIAGTRIGIPIYRQQRAIAAVEQAGGQVDVELFGPECFVRWAAHHKFSGIGRVQAVWLVGEGITDEALDLLGSFADLEALGLDSPKFTSDALSRATSLKNLRSLELSEGNYIDDDLARLSAMTHLRSLFVSSPNITDASIVHLTVLTNLDVLCLENTQITTQGVEIIQRALPKTQINLRHGIGCNFASPHVAFKYHGGYLTGDE